MSRVERTIHFRPRTALPIEEAAHLARAVGRVTASAEYDRGKAVLHFEEGDALEIAVDSQAALVIAAICSRGARRGGAALCFGWQECAATPTEGP